MQLCYKNNLAKKHEMMDGRMVAESARQHRQIYMYVGTILKQVYLPIPITVEAIGSNALDILTHAYC